MTRPLYLILLLACMFSIGACETIVEIDMPEHEPLLVVNSLFRAGDPILVELSNSRGLNEQPHRDVERADVLLFENGQLIEELAPDSFGIRFESTWIPLAGRAYTIRASAPGFESVEATELVPDSAVVSVTANRLQDQPFDWSDEYEIIVQLNDEPGSTNYYAIWITAVQYIGDTPASNVGYAWTQYFSSRDPVLRDGKQIGLFDDESDYYMAQFSDRAIDGKSHEIRLTTSLMRPNTGFYSPDGKPLDVDRVRYYLTFRSISEAFYRHLKATQKIDESTPFDEPVQLPSNVKGGLGIFAASNGADHFIADVYPDR